MHQSSETTAADLRAVLEAMAGHPSGDGVSLFHSEPAAHWSVPPFLAGITCMLTS